SIHRRIEGVFAPQIRASLTPGMVWYLSLKIFSASRVRSINDLLVLLMLVMMIGYESASAFETTGGSQSGGRLLIARDTLSRTSFAAASRSTSRSNSTEMVLLPSRLTEVRDFIPDIPLTDSSRGSVICDSMTSALAPV